MYQGHGLWRSQNLHKIISTHLLTVLIISVILQLEQRKGNKKKEQKVKRLTVPRTWFLRNKVDTAYRKKGEMTYVDA